jgi:hypothetical protein
MGRVKPNLQKNGWGLWSVVEYFCGIAKSDRLFVRFLLLLLLLLLFGRRFLPRFWA